MLRRRIFLGTMLGGATLSAVPLCVVLILIVKEFHQFNEFSMMVTMAYLMIGGTAAASILAVSAFVGGIVILFVPKEKKTQP